MSRGFESGCLPEHVRKLLPKESKADLGKQALTMPEIDAKAAVQAEKELHRQLEQWLRLREIPFGTSRMDRKSSFTVGWPDYTLCIKGYAVFLELKTGSNDLDPEQVVIKDALERAGAIYGVCRSLAQCIEFICDVWDTYEGVAPSDATGKTL